MTTFQHIQKSAICLASAMAIVCSILLPANAATHTTKANPSMPTEPKFMENSSNKPDFDSTEEAYQVAMTSRKHTSIISAGLYHSCWLQDDGTLVWTGSNEHGQCFPKNK